MQDACDAAAAQQMAESVLQRLQCEMRLGDSSEWAEVLPKLVLHRGWHRLNNTHVRLLVAVAERTSHLTRFRNTALVKTRLVR